MDEPPCVCSVRSREQEREVLFTVCTAHDDMLSSFSLLLRFVVFVCFGRLKASPPPPLPPVTATTATLYTVYYSSHKSLIEMALQAAAAATTTTWTEGLCGWKQEAVRGESTLAISASGKQ